AKGLGNPALYRRIYGHHIHAVNLPPFLIQKKLSFPSAFPSSARDHAEVQNQTVLFGPYTLDYSGIT
ncbi:MAG: hypothetical protein LUH04_14380, partial [Clostridium sp.]|nr:hypothetical protein [Clostridium sp.]